MNTIGLIQIALCTVALWGMIAFHNRKWWLVGACIPVVLFYITPYIPDGMIPIELPLFLVPESVAKTSSTLLHLFTIELPIWAIAVGVSTSFFAHVSFDSVQQKSLAILYIGVPLVILLFLFRFLLITGMASI